MPVTATVEWAILTNRLKIAINNRAKITMSIIVGDYAIFEYICCFSNYFLIISIYYLNKAGLSKPGFGIYLFISTLSDHMKVFDS